MPKIAYLTGVPGAGKSWVGNRVSVGQHAQWIHGDVVRKHASQILCPSVSVLGVWSESLWEQLLRHSDVLPSLEAAIKDCVIPQLEKDKPLVVDAYLTSHADFRIAFSEALRTHGVEIDDNLLFWLDTPLERVVSQANNRITNGERPNEDPIDLSEAMRRRDRIVRRVRNTAVVKVTDAETAVKRIVEFLRS